MLAAVDIDPVHLAVHSYNFPLTESLCGDISRVTRDQIHAIARKGWSRYARAGEWDGVIDCLFGGPSCQGFSEIGSRSSNDDRNSLVFEFARLVEVLQPRTFVIENVPGLLNMPYTSTVRDLSSQLVAAGYKLHPECPVRLNACNYGVPQRRERVFLVGFRTGEAVPTLPQSHPSRVTVADALDDLPSLEEYPELTSGHELRMSEQTFEVLTGRAGPYARSLRRQYALEYERSWDDRMLTGCQRTIHSEAVVQRFTELRPGQVDQPSNMPRLDPRDYSCTLRAGTGPDHGSFTAPRPVHPAYPRVITVREAARLHSFPDWFEFHVTKWHGLRQIGNSVPPRLAAAVAKQIAAGLGYTPSAPTKVLDRTESSLLSLSLREAAVRLGLPVGLLPRDVRRVSEKLDAASGPEEGTIFRGN